VGTDTASRHVLLFYELYAKQFLLEIGAKRKRARERWSSVRSFTSLL
jgi:hypothetical protein